MVYDVSIPMPMGTPRGTNFHDLRLGPLSLDYESHVSVRVLGHQFLIEVHHDQFGLVPCNPIRGDTTCEKNKITNLSKF
jgi:hypothetical protein